MPGLACHSRSLVASSLLRCCPALTLVILRPCHLASLPIPHQMLPRCGREEVWLLRPIGSCAHPQPARPVSETPSLLAALVLSSAEAVSPLVASLAAFRLWLGLRPPSRPL